MKENTFNVMCIDNYKADLTLNKIYTATTYQNTDFYIVYDDSGDDNVLLKKRFKTLKDIRNDKIDKIII